MRVQFWGTRGSVPCPGPETLRYGGNTACVEVRSADGTLLIFDCGTGCRKLGRALAESGPIEAHLFVSHTHADHIQGLPFFAPLYLPDSKLTVYGPAGIDRSFRDAVSGLMSYAYFPVPIDDLPAAIEFVELGEGEFSIGDISIMTQYLNHTSPCLGYRVESGGGALAYVTDHEPHTEQLWRTNKPVGPTRAPEFLHPGDARHAAFIQNCDLVIHDAQYTAEEYPEKRGWGHSTVEYVVDLALAAGVGHVVLFHHDPNRPDDSLDELLAASRKVVSAAGATLEISAATEGAAIVIDERAQPAPDDRGPRAPRLPTRARILVADDDDSVAKLLEFVLAGDGYDVRRARTGVEAVRLAGQHQFDLLLLDVLMPEMDGLAACREIRADPRLADVPIVLLTARGEEEEIANGLAEGATDYMTKPFSVSQVRARVRSWLMRVASTED